MSGWPRRADIKRMTDAELTIYRAMQKVEQMGAHELLTKAVVLLGEAKDAVADFVDREEKKV